MRLQKRIILVSTMAAIASFILALIFYIKAHAFCSNVFLGLFASSFLICVVAIITYISERHDTIYKLYCSCMDFSQVFPFGISFSTKEEILSLMGKIAEEQAIYNKEIQFYLDELLIQKNSDLSKTLSTIKTSIKIVFDALLDLNAKLQLCMCGSKTINDISTSLSINSKDVSNAAEQFTRSVNDLVKYIKDKKIHEWEERSNNAD